MNLWGTLSPAPTEGADDFIKGMKACGYDIESYHQIDKSKNDLMLAMAKRIQALERVGKANEAEFERITSIAEATMDSIEHLAQFLPEQP